MQQNIQMNLSSLILLPLVSLATIFSWTLLLLFFFQCFFSFNFLFFLSLASTIFHKHTYTHTHTHTHNLSLSHSLTHSLTHTLHLLLSFSSPVEWDLGANGKKVRGEGARLNEDLVARGCWLVEGNLKKWRKRKEKEEWDEERESKRVGRWEMGIVRELEGQKEKWRRDKRERGKRGRKRKEEEKEKKRRKQEE